MSKISTSQKHRNFILEPMGEKLVTEVAGIGPVYGKKLQDQGFETAYMLLGQFLLLKKDEELFTEWLVWICGANANYAAQCFRCLDSWCNSFL